MAPKKHPLKILCECVYVCVCALTHMGSLCAEAMEMKVCKSTFWNLEKARARWLDHCAPRCHRDTLTRRAKAAHMACWLSSFLDAIM